VTDQVVSGHSLQTAAQDPVVPATTTDHLATRRPVENIRARVPRIVHTGARAVDHVVLEIEHHGLAYLRLHLRHRPRARGGDDRGRLMAWRSPENAAGRARPWTACHLREHLTGGR
jgi:hypothetical protein